MEVIKGIGVSRGIGIGKAILIDKKEIAIPHIFIKPSSIKNEILRFKNAIAKTKRELQEIKNNLDKKTGKDVRFILEAHTMLLQDKAFHKRCIEIMKNEKINAEWAVEKVLQEIRDSFQKITDNYLKERGQDVEYVFTRVLKNFKTKRIRRKRVLKGIVIAVDLSPAETAQFKREHISGIATDMGSRTSHTAILAKALNIPAVLGLERITSIVKPGDNVIVDAQKGEVIVNPTIQVLNEYLKRQKELIKEDREYKKLSRLPSRTADGVHIKLMANIELLEELESVTKNGAEGIGLFRTEFLYLNRNGLPDEEEHFYVYKHVAEKIAPLPVIIRTVDIGGDKISNFIGAEKETNPALGLRAIRLCLKNPEIFKTQLRAILRASAYGNLRILIPMIADINEIRLTKYFISEIKSELRSKNIKYNENIPIGIMIETPSASIIPDILAREVDFFSIGTNDLIQYSLAIDRSNEHVAYLYNPLHPAILRFIRNIVTSAKRAGIEVNLCGEMASDSFFVPVLIGLGLRQLSMDPQYIPIIKNIIYTVNSKTSTYIVQKALRMPDTHDIAELIKKRFSMEILKSNFI